MHIDWFVFFAQIVNFLILVFLLKRFLYGRIIRAMDTRQAKIAEGFEEAEKQRQALEAAKEEFEEKTRSLKESYDKMMSQAVAEVAMKRKDLLDQARKDVAEIKTRWQETILRDMAAFMQDLRQRAGRQVYAIARRVIGDLADAELEGKMVDAFIRNVTTCEDGKPETIRSLFPEDGTGVVIQSAFPLSQDQQHSLNDVLSRCAGRQVEATYETSDDILAGIELRTPGHKIAWSMNDYLENLNERFSTVLQEEARSG